MNRIVGALTLALLLLRTLPVSALSVVPSVRSFLSSAQVPPEIKEPLLTIVQAQPNAGQWISLSGSYIATLTAARLPEADLSEPAFQLAAVRDLLMRCKHLLFLHAAGTRYTDLGFHDTRALAQALLQTDDQIEVKGRFSSGIQQLTDVVQGVGIAIAVIKADRVEVYRSRMPSKERITPPYCLAAYAKVGATSTPHNCNKTLPVLEQLLRLGCTPPDISIDVAACGLQSGQTDNARQVLLRTLDHDRATLTSMQAERIGTLLLAAHMNREAKEAFELALERLRQGSVSNARQ